MTIQYYANADINGKIIGFYNDDIWDSTKIPTTAIRITEVQWEDCTSNQGKWIIMNGALSAAPTPTESELLALSQAKKKKEISDAVSAKIVSGYHSAVVLASTGKSHFYGTTLVDQQNMTASRVDATANPSKDIKYRPQDALERVVHTHDEFVLVSDGVMSLVSGILDQGYALYVQLYVATTISEVDAIIVTIT